MTVAKDLEKTGSYEVEEVALTANPGSKGDYSGAVAKTDSVEIKLVRKLDFRIMPTLWGMYFLCVLFLVQSLYGFAHQRRQELTGPKRHPSGKTQ